MQEKKERFAAAAQLNSRENWIAAILILYLMISFNGAFAADYTIFALACPFKTITDKITEEELIAISAADPQRKGEIHDIYISQETKEAFPHLFRKSAAVDDPVSLISEKSPYVSCAVIPIEQMNPTMKYVLAGNDKYPWDKDYDPDADILAVKGGRSNFDRSKLATVLITGTTALARTTSYKMYLNGPLYPAELIKPVFDNSDITHISNESSIWSLCPEPTHTEGTMQFCSNLRSYDLFDYLGADVIELSGNHLRDYDWKPLLEMLDTFDQKGYRYYAAGRDYEESEKALFIEHNGNKFAFVGCNIAGPEHVYVDDTRPGVNRCDFDKMEKEIRKLKDDGYIVIATIQYYETYSRVPTSMQKEDFGRLSAAGADIVSGSQAHYSQTFLPMEDRFIHYGLGNLFFDQMDIPVVGTRQEFLDRYVFYEGKLLNVQLITALLTDYARPRLMVEYERTDFLREIFGNM
ncbi:MAG: CapA family protein [Anaerolineaceae bacterium]|nr:CapA family protein [Anaerolineaceae bacterium]